MRVLLYSHDTFGLGHLRRSRTIAHALTARFPTAEIAIVTGSPFAGTFNFHDHIIYLQIPPVTKRSDGTYTSMEAGVALDYTVGLRTQAIVDFMTDWKPDLFIVDKEPLGFRHELVTALEIAKERRIKVVLGLRDVLDSPNILQEEWERKGIFGKLEHFYDEIWIYGPASFYDPLQKLPLGKDVHDKMVYTGFLDRKHDPFPDDDGAPKKHVFDDYILVTVGGGGDGYLLMKSVINMVKTHPSDKNNYLMVLGPFMGRTEGEELRGDAAGISNIEIIDFDPELEDYVERARAIIGMCGYNTFCEVLTFDKPAMYVPRSVPRLEQQIRSYRAASMGWSSVLEASEAQNPEVLYNAVETLLTRKPPSAAHYQPDMAGLDTICERVEALVPDIRRNNVIRMS
ncbi:glycosyltransferase family protein [Rhizobium sp. L1K21]|uniref:glycosyltransferase family protein n=1 Tax=Rhizobium sp. L1K21 TaxID=2954933 RepID=UPI00209298EB|nr:glycosyltransferase [Rhizobium sp. L1K21]MCO6187643.1 hypothetical protein [Rhizobium sp. L1K21]